jgi:hypothetical protein
MTLVRLLRPPFLVAVVQRGRDGSGTSCLALRRPHKRNGRPSTTLHTTLRYTTLHTTRLVCRHLEAAISSHSVTHFTAQSVAGTASLFTTSYDDPVAVSEATLSWHTDKTDCGRLWVGHGCISIIAWPALLFCCSSTVRRVRLRPYQKRPETRMLHTTRGGLVQPYLQIQVH